jgi:hypothetical protein
MAAHRFTLTVRNGPQVTRERFQTLEQALDAMCERLEQLSPHAKRERIDVYTRRFDASLQVTVRAEISGAGGWLLGGAKGGVDLRGDGSAEAYTGRVRRRLIELQPGESACEGLRRVLGADAAQLT